MMANFTFQLEIKVSESGRKSGDAQMSIFPPTVWGALSKPHFNLNLFTEMNQLCDIVTEYQSRILIYWQPIGKFPADNKYWIIAYNKTVDLFNSWRLQSFL